MSNPSPLHLVGHFNDPHAGAERTLLELAAGLAARRPVVLWSDVAPHSDFQQQGVRAIRPFAGEFPKGGRVLFSGPHLDIGQIGIWLPHAGVSRVGLRYNLPNHGALFAMMQCIQDSAAPEPEIMFVSRALQESVGLPGVIEPSLIDIAPFVSIDVARPLQRRFTVGRLSRDVPEKHHTQDAAMYRLLAAQGIAVRVMGGTCLQGALAGVTGVELLPAGAESTAEFFASLDVFFYRTGSVYEAYGRVIFEAMASALPVVAGHSGGYAESVLGDHGVALVASQEQAFQVLMACASDAPLRQREGEKARLRALELHGAPVKEAVLTRYLN